jgi:hypothetical protein
MRIRKHSADLNALLVITAVGNPPEALSRVAAAEDGDHGGNGLERRNLSIAPKSYGLTRMYQEAHSKVGEEGPHAGSGFQSMMICSSVQPCLREFLAPATGMAGQYTACTPA